MLLQEELFRLFFQPLLVEIPVGLLEVVPMLPFTLFEFSLVNIALVFDKASMNLLHVHLQLVALFM